MNKLEKLGLAAASIKILRDAGVDTIDALAPMADDALRALKLSKSQIRSIRDRLHLLHDDGHANVAYGGTTLTHEAAGTNEEPPQLFEAAIVDELFASPPPPVDELRPQIAAVGEDETDAAGAYFTADVLVPPTAPREKDFRVKAKTDDNRALASAAAHERLVAARPASSDARIAALRANPTMTVKDAAYLYSVSTDVVYDMCRRNEIPHKRCGQRIRIKTAPLLRDLGIE